VNYEKAGKEHQSRLYLGAVDEGSDEPGSSFFTTETRPANGIPHLL